MKDETAIKISYIIAAVIIAVIGMITDNTEIALLAAGSALGVGISQTAKTAGIYFFKKKAD